MEPVFDRYLPRGGERYLDLATSRFVAISLRDVLDEDWRRRWRVRVDALLEGCEGLERLVDAGESGTHAVFEVRELPAAMHALSRGEQCTPALTAIAWLAARDLSIGSCHRGRLIDSGVLCADVQTGWPVETAGERAAAARSLRAWQKLLGAPARRMPISPRVDRARDGVTLAGAIHDRRDRRAGLVPIDAPIGDVLRGARASGFAAVNGACHPARLPAEYLARRSFVIVEPQQSSAAIWAAALAATGGRRHFVVGSPPAASIARERPLAYLSTPQTDSCRPSTHPPAATRAARRRLTRARTHLEARQLASAIRVAGRAALLAGDGTPTQSEALMVKAHALRCVGNAREALSLLQPHVRQHPATAGAGVLVECAEAACDLTLFEQAEAFARAALLAASDAPAQRRARLALDRARVWRGEAVDTEFWQARSAWHRTGSAPRWPARGGYAHAPCGPLAVWEHMADRLERAMWGGTKHEVERLKARFGRTVGRLPPLLRVRMAWLTTGDETLARRVGARGVLQTGKAGAVMEIFEHMSALLTACYESSSDESALQAAAARTRRILRARSVAIFTADRPLPLAGDGDGWNVTSALARRCCEAAQTAAPQRCGDAASMAVSIRGPEAPAGAIVAAWPPGVPIEISRATLLLEAAALVLVPILRNWPPRDDRSPADDTPEIVGVSPAIATVRDSIRRVARVPFAVLIEGESGVGKELVARAIHRLSSRASRPFRALNCAAMAEELVEAELFGHAQGAYTGAVTARAGLFEDADRGTLFLDEVAELSPRAQAKLLRVLQEGEVRRVGETTSRRVDVRIVAATNRPLADAVAAHAFRADLFFRLDVLRIAVPPLRARREDVPVLCAHFWRDAAARAGTSALLSAEALGHLAAYDWPGNVRELQNVIAAMAVSCPRRGRAGADHLPAHVRGGEPPLQQTLHQARATLERDLVRHALARAGGKPARAAAELGLSRQGLAKLMRRLGLPAA